MPEQALLGGDLIDGKYQIDRLLGQGGMGAVYRATHLGTKRVVAVKVINPQFSSNAEFVERFRREAEATGRLRHPNVVDVTDFGFAAIATGRVAYLVMEYLDGCTLAEVLAEEVRLPLDWVVDILEQVCSAVDEAHRIGIVHRDLKPENIWLEPNRRGGYTIKVLDFGLAKLGLPALPHGDASANSGGIGVSGFDSASQSRSVIGSTPAEPPTLMQQAGFGEAATAIQHPGSGDAVTGIQHGGAGDAATAIQPAEQGDAATAIQHLDVTGIQSLPAAATGVGQASRLQAGNSETETLRFDNRGTRPVEPADTAGAGGLTRIGAVMGTPLYMSPEQCRGEHLDGRSDIYSIGVIAYRMLCGETPFKGSLDELIKLHATQAPPSLREKNRKVPRRVARLIQTAMAKDPSERPESTAGFASALRARAEGTGTLLRQSVSLYSENFPAFLKIALLAYSPLIALLGIVYALDNSIPWEHMSQGGIVALLLALGISGLVGHLFAYSVISAVTVPIVIQLTVAPLRPVRIRSALALLRRSWRVFAMTTIVVTSLIFLGSALIVPGIVIAVCYALYAPVAVTEGLGVRATMRRARHLAKRAWTTVLTITLIEFALPILISSRSGQVSVTLNAHHAGVNVSNSNQFSQLLLIVVTPLTAIMTALLYLKTRQAGGETLRAAIDQFDAHEIPRSKWQARMRTRSTSQGSSTSGF
jgi:serine/threonine protein kinase